MDDLNVFNDYSWKDKISNPHQMGGIEVSVVENGAGRGSRIAWVNTGSGLRFKVLLDRGMDVADAFYNEQSLAWISHLGATRPLPHAHQGADWIKAFGGGLFVTCGLDHIGNPEQDEHGHRGLHGAFSNLPVELLSVKQPDPLSGDFSMHITGIIRQSQPLGLQFELKRTLSMVLGQSTLFIHDELLNRGNTPAPHMLLYHFNFGWPLVDEGSKIYWQGKWIPRESGSANQLFKEGRDFYSCPSPLNSHAGAGEEAVFVDIAANQEGVCVAGIYNEKRAFGIGLSFFKNQLPWLTNWQHWGKGEYVTGLEPGTHPPIGQAKARRDGSLLFLEPGEKREYQLRFDVVNQPVDANHFYKPL